MTPEQILLALAPVAYLIGSIPFGLVVALSRGVDPRKAGSGNIGATNIGRLLGAKYFVIVFLLDLLKGAVPTAAAGAVINFRANDRATCLLWMLVALSAILGHVFSLFLKFRGGKGVATSAGVVFVAVFLLTRYVSVASMIGSSAIPIAYAWIGYVLGWPMLGAQLPLLIFSILVPVMIVYKHRGNIARLRAGTENRFGRKK